MNIIRVSALILMLQLASEAKAQIKVNKSQGLDAAVAARSGHRKNPNTRIKGYQILIYNGSARSTAESVKNRFEAEFKHFSEVVWDEPNFKVYVGCFTSKFECMKLLEEIKSKYQTAIVVSNMVPYAPLN